MRSLVSVSLFSLSLVAFGALPASAQLKINPYPTQAQQPEGRIAPSDQLDAAVVQELLARQRNREAEAAPVSVVNPQPVYTSPPVQAAPEPILAKQPLLATPPSIEPTKIVPRVFTQPARTAEPVQFIQPEQVVGAPVEYVEPVALKPMAVVQEKIMSAPVQPAPRVNPLLDHVTVIVQPRNVPSFTAPQGSRVQSTVDAVPQPLDVMPEVAVSSVRAVPVEAVESLQDVSSAKVAEPVSTSAMPNLDYKALARQQLALSSPVNVVSPVDNTKAVKAGLPAGSLGGLNIATASPVRLNAAPTKVVTNRDDLLPVTALAPIESVQAPIVAASAPAVLEPVQFVSRVESLKPVDQKVDALDNSAEAVPAQMQEQLAMKAMKSQQGMIIADPLEGRMGGNLADVARVKVDPLNEKDAVALLEEADQILEASIVKPAVETLVMPDDAELTDPLQDSRGNKIVYNQDNIRDAMTAEASAVNKAATDPVSLVPASSSVSADIDVAPARAVAVDKMAGWQAEAGESAYGVLKQWSQQAGVELIWDSEFLVNVRNHVSVSGSYEQAVTTLLDQYSDLYAGVQGTLYNDAQSGRKVLHVQTNDRG